MRPASFPVLFILTLFVLNGCAKAPRSMMGAAGSVPPSSEAYGLYHTVVRGETLYRISKKYNVDMGELMRANHLYSPNALASDQKLYIPGAAVPPPFQPAYRAAVPQNIRDLVGPRNSSSDWRTLTVHHSATTQGSARLFDRDHHRRRMGGLFYHFVIGNGTNTGDGEIEVGWRWKKQVKASRPNDIQICLVGNFDKEYVSKAQFNGLADLMGVLKEQYSIPLSAIRKHGDIRGKHTNCPGKHFPFDRLMARLANDSR
ncbi:MAG: hypothetical protein A3C47_03495 [Omnitrophica bacterium RIFCSPHIGHO2_02_FULL_51_18]|nr:MAG: hypothetical protein A3C47_03495 [Omnitrophica bacterium RIFCSPHIGHO2_02_FULL_51_18]